jgi:hypothetical protein
MDGRRFASAAALMTRLGPGLTSTTAAPAGHPDWYLNRHDMAKTRLALRDRYLGQNKIVLDALPEEGISHSFHDPSDREKIDRGLIRKTFVRHQSLVNDRSHSSACQGNAMELCSTRIMPATTECPQCGGTMRLRESKTTTHVPGNPSATVRVTREWVCPDCDYYEEVEEETR